MGKHLSADSGSWSASAAFTYRWVRCDAYFANCADIPGATAATYTVVAADAGHVLGVRVRVTAANAAAALFNGLGPATADPPAPTNRPSVKGTVGRAVYETADLWSHSRDTFTIRWLRCSAGGNACVRITVKRLRCAGGSCLRVNVGTERDYRLTDKDVAHRLRVRVAAWNGAGHATSSLDANAHRRELTSSPLKPSLGDGALAWANVAE